MLIRIGDFESFQIQDDLPFREGFAFIDGIRERVLDAEFFDRSIISDAEACEKDLFGGGISILGLKAAAGVIFPEIERLVFDEAFGPLVERCSYGHSAPTPEVNYLRETAFFELVSAVSFSQMQRQRYRGDDETQAEVGFHQAPYRHIASKT